MGIAWSEQRVPSGSGACRDARGPERNAAAGVRDAFGGVRDATAAGQAPETGTRAEARTEVVRSAGGTRLAEGAVGRSGRASRRVLEQWGMGIGLEPLDGDHEPAAAGRALVQRLPGECLEAVAVVGRWHADQAAAPDQLPPAAAAGELTEVPDAMEGGRQDVQQEAADKLLGGERHGLEAVRLAVVFLAEADAAVRDGEEAVVGDRRAVGVAAEVGEDAGGNVEGRLGVDDPVGLAQGLEVAVALRGEAAAGDDAVQVGMEGETQSS